MFFILSSSQIWRHFKKILRKTHEEGRIEFLFKTFKHILENQRNFTELCECWRIESLIVPDIEICDVRDKYGGHIGKYGPS